MKATKNKKFDCVRMKRDIQQKISKEFSATSDEQAHKIKMDRAMQNPQLGPFCKKLRLLKKTSTK